MTPGQLVKAMAIALDVPVETVVQHDRNLAVAGLRTTGARGRNAPDVTPLDAARLLVATLGSVRTKDSVETVRAFEDAKFRPEQSEVAKSKPDLVRGGPPSSRNPLYFGGFFDPAIMSLAPDHNFVEAIASLIHHATVDLENQFERFGPLSVTCSSPELRAGIKHSSIYGPGAVYFPKKRPELKNYYGIIQRREASGVTIVLLGKAFRDGGLPFDGMQGALDALTVKKASAKSKKAT